MLSRDCIVVVKALTVFHYIFREGIVMLAKVVVPSARPNFKLDNYSDVTRQGTMHALFIKSYAAYLEQWLVMKTTVRRGNQNIWRRSWLPYENP